MYKGSFFFNHIFIKLKRKICCFELVLIDWSLCLFISGLTKRRTSILGENLRRRCHTTCMTDSKWTNEGAYRWCNHDWSIKSIFCNTKNIGKKTWDFNDGMSDSNFEIRSKSKRLMMFYRKRTIFNLDLLRTNHYSMIWRRPIKFEIDKLLIK